MQKKLKHLPVLLSIVIAVIVWASLGGLFFPDTAQFLRHTFTGRQWVSFNVISPVYPLFLDILCVLFPPSLRMPALVITQLIGVVIVVWAVRRIGDLYNCSVTGWTASILTALYLPLYYFAVTAQTESLYVFFVIVSIFFLSKGLNGGLNYWIILAGAMAGLAVGQRSVGIAIPAAFCLVILLGRERQKWIRLLGFFVGWVCTLLALMSVNYIHYQRFNLCSGIGIHLFGRIAMVDRWAPNTPEYKEIRSIANRTGLTTPFVKEGGWILHGALCSQEKITEDQADALLREAAIQSLTGRPWETIKHTLSSMSYMLIRLDSKSYILWGGLRPEEYRHFEDFVSKCFSADPPVQQAYHRCHNHLLPPYPPKALVGSWIYPVMETWGNLTTIISRGSWVLFVLFLAFLIGIARRDTSMLMLSFVAFFQLLAAAMGDQPVHRYWDPSVPMFFLVATMLTGLLFKFISNQYKLRRKEPTRHPTEAL